MTEKEELEKGVAESKARQQTDALVAYLRKVNDECFQLYLWTRRADAGFFLALSAQMVINFLCYSTHPGEVVQELSTAAMQLIVVLMIARSWMHTRAWGNKESERRGAHKVLQILGYIKPDGDAETRQKRPLWEKGIQAVEAWTAKRKEQFGKGFGGTVPA